MTNTEIIQAIRKEVERRMNGNPNYVTYKELESILSFLSTLESEKPVPADLEEAAVDIADALLAKPKDYALSAKADYWNGAHDGIIAGAKWQADHTPLPEDTVLFQKGVEEGKRLMMEEAVEGEVVKTFPEDGFVSVHYPIPPIGRMAYFCKYNGQNIGDKVRIIVIPKED